MMELINGSPDVCISGGLDQDVCVGPVHLYRSVTGASASWRCEHHQEKYVERMAPLKAEVDRKYPGWDVPNSPAPDWFDPMYAGERWDDDY